MLKNEYSFVVDEELFPHTDPGKYSSVAEWCNKNQTHIIADENGKFFIRALPKADEKEILEQEIALVENQLDNVRNMPEYIRAYDEAAEVMATGKEISKYAQDKLVEASLYKEELRDQLNEKIQKLETIKKGE